MTYLPSKNIIPTDYDNRNILLSTSGELLTSPQGKSEIDIKINNNTVSYVYDFLTPTTPSGSSVTLNRGALILNTISSDFSIQSKGIMSVKPGCDSRIEFMCSFDPAGNTNGQKAGVNNALSELYFGYSSGSFCIGYTRDTVNDAPVIILSSAFNFGNNSNYQSQFANLNPLIMNLYAIHFNASGRVTFEWYEKNYGWVVLHDLATTDDTFSPFYCYSFRLNLLTKANVSGTHLSFCYAHSKSFFNADYSSHFGRRLTSNVNLKAIPNTTQIPILSLRCPSTFNSLNNMGKIVLDSITSFTTAGQQTHIDLMMNPTLTGSSFNPYSSTYTEFFTQVDTSATAITLSPPPLSIYSFCLPANNSGGYSNIKLPPIVINAGDTLSFVGNSDGASGTINFHVNYFEVI